MIFVSKMEASSKNRDVTSKSFCKHNVWRRCHAGFFKIFFVAKHRKTVGGCTRVRITLSWQGRRTKGRQTKSEACIRTAIQYYALFLVCRADKKYKRIRRSICLCEHCNERLPNPLFPVSSSSLKLLVGLPRRKDWNWIANRHARVLIILSV